ncbi:DUF6653 family protein [Bowmanella denitrificans]|uniref:DUF6653 family protein n=1 Tax=Bowmanella denitrificans TaxID=366582 RepID=UPI000C9B72DD|nr:DUF6653 family protein [Bowmanella denitrificans]
MTLERKLAKIFMLDDDGWERHANPLSVWTRYSVLPIFAFAGFLREWNVWMCGALIVIALAWTFFNPILFSKPKNYSSWASKSVLGERIYINRDIYKLPEHHNSPIFMVLNAISSAGVMACFWGVYKFDAPICMLGILITYLAKSWFLDRMVWLFNDVNSDRG